MTNKKHAVLMDKIHNICTVEIIQTHKSESLVFCSSCNVHHCGVLSENIHASIQAAQKQADEIRRQIMKFKT